MDRPPSPVIDILDDADDETLEAVIRYCERELERHSDDVTDEPKRDMDPPEDFVGDGEQWAEAVDGTDAPGRATLTTKTISGNEYYYWQWSQDGKTESEYICPKHPKK